MGLPSRSRWTCSRVRGSCELPITSSTRLASRANEPYRGARHAG
jgi:hypothetical protein